MVQQQPVNILLVDDQPAKLLSYEVILSDLGENLIKASSASEALACLLKTDVALVLMDVDMPEFDGFQLAQMIREHPRFQKTAIVFVSAIQLSHVDHLRGYEIGAVDYVSVPVVPEVLRAKVKVFVELHRKTRELEKLNDELEERVAQRTAEIEASTARLRQSEERRTLALSAGNMGSWDLDVQTGQYVWDEGQYEIYGVDPQRFVATHESIRALIHPDDRAHLTIIGRRGSLTTHYKHEFRVVRPSGEIRWCFGAVAPTLDVDGVPTRLSGVTVDITERKQAEDKQVLLAREVDHRAKNALAVVQSIVRLTRAKSTSEFVRTVEGRIQALAMTHKLLSSTRWEGANLGQIVDEEMSPYRADEGDRVVTGGPLVMLLPSTAQSVALALHELATNAAKYGALSTEGGTLRVQWTTDSEALVIQWTEVGGPATSSPSSLGFGLKIVRSGIEDQLSGGVNYDWRQEGLACRLSIPIARIANAGPDGAPPEAPQEAELNGHAHHGLAGKRILVVEDEFLISMFMENVLAELGVGVVGPASTLAEGFSAAQNERIDGAILDLNLGGTQTYPLADVLTAKGVPFVFVTGYDSEMVDHRYNHVLVLQKPIESEILKRALISDLLPQATRVAQVA